MCRTLRSTIYVYAAYTMGCVPYHWLAATLAALHGIEPHEVL
jgi:hypothetical protein